MKINNKNPFNIKTRISFWLKSLISKIWQLFHKKEFLVLFLVWFGGFFLRIYRLDDLLGFYYDQGRDALKVSEILTLKDLPAIGPTTGLSGIFLGPFWFYFITPFYWLGGGDPAIAAAFIGLIDSLTIILLYFVGKHFFSKKVGFLAAVFWAFSYWLIRSARWFSNPSPIPFFTMILVWGLGEWLINRKQKWLPIIFVCLAISTQLEVASAVFYFPAILFLILFFKIQIKQLLRQKYFWLGIILFLLFLLPQFAFEIKNNFVMSRNLLGFFGGEVNTATGESWAIPTKEIIFQRLNWYYQVFFAHLDPNLKLPKIIVGLIWSILVIHSLLKTKKSFFSLIFIFWLTPLIFLLFFIGNYGNLYDYYLTGFFPVFILLSAFVFSRLPSLITVIFLFYFFWQNGILTRGYLFSGLDGPITISLGNQKQTIEWVCQEAKNEPFNIDIYVPPVIPYSWDYLWQWYGCKNLKCCPTKNLTPILYTIYEVDSPHPERLENWLKDRRLLVK